MMAELDSETLRELRRIQTAQNLQQRVAQTTVSSGMGAVGRGEYTPETPAILPTSIPTPVTDTTPVPIPKTVPAPTPIAPEIGRAHV